MRRAVPFASIVLALSLAGCPTFTSRDEPTFAQTPNAADELTPVAPSDRAAPTPTPAAPPAPRPPSTPQPAPPVPEDVAAAPASATRTPSGLAYRVLHPGAGTRHPTAANTVEVHYTGWTTDGRMFDSSVTRGTPATFPLGGVIRGWTEGVQLMTEGEKVRFWIPGELAYDTPGMPARPGVPHGTLVFDVELLHIQ